MRNILLCLLFLSPFCWAGDIDSAAVRQLADKTRPQSGFVFFKAVYPGEFIPLADKSIAGEVWYGKGVACKGRNSSGGWFYYYRELDNKTFSFHPKDVLSYTYIYGGNNYDPPLYIIHDSKIIEVWE